MSLTINETIEQYAAPIVWGDGIQLTPRQIEAYTKRLHNHIRHVREAGKRLGVQQHLLDCHDDSKWSRHEFPYYAAYFCSGIDESPLDAAARGGAVTDGFARAWLHHIHNGPHHWQHWIFADGFSPEGSKVENGVVRMPEPYVREMVADWMGASKTYTGRWDMMEWLNDNLVKITLHSQAWETLRGILAELDYELRIDHLANVYRVRDVNEPKPKPKAIQGLEAQS